MKQNIESINLKTIENHAGGKAVYVDGKFFMTMSSKLFALKFLAMGRTYRVDEGRLMRIVSGKASCFINLQPYTLQKGMLLFVSPATIFEIENCNEDFDLQAFSLIEQPEGILPDSCVEFHLSDSAWKLTDDYFRLLWNEANQPVRSPLSILHLQTALLARLRLSADSAQALSNKDIRLQHFLSLVNEHGLHEHSIAFYAGKLCVTPNHLGFVIKRASGLTVGQWINRYIIQQAKIRLKYADLPIEQIAEQLNFSNSSAFAKFFKKEVGMTPGKYRKA